jgi:tetratricopeptide repeat protein
MRAPNRSRSVLCAVAAACALLAGGSPAGAFELPWAKDKPLEHVVRDPYYGDALFYFYQQRYFTSVTGLMVSQHFDRLSHHADEAEVLRGGLFLSYGMHREAGEIFARLIEQGASPPVRDRAWYYLAKIRYQRGLLGQAEEAIDRVGTTLPPDLEDDRRLLQANLLMARGDYADAIRVLQRMTENGPASSYARYNLGVALVKNGDVAAGIGWLDGIGKAPAADEEMRSLRDKANLALGFAALQDNHPEQAGPYLERVRLSGMLANKALLGFGWAAASQKQPQLALVSWTELAGRDASDPAVLEAKLAVPYAYGELGAYGKSLDQYNDAIAAFDQESASIDESVAAIRSGKLLESLLDRNPGDEMGWFWSIEQLPKMPHARHLAQVFAQHDFQEAFKNYRDLQFLTHNLQQWQENLGIYGDMLANRRQAYAERLPQVKVAERASGIDDLTRRAARLHDELARTEQERDGAAFADARERELGARLDRVRALLDAGSGAGKRTGASDDPLADARERYRRVAGALGWQLADEFAPRLWDARKDLKAVDAGLADARTRDAAVARAQVDEPARFEQFAARIVELRRRIEELLPRVAQLSREQQGYVQELAVVELAHEKERLAVYSTQARFALAQTYDRANNPKEPPRAPAQ